MKNVLKKINKETIKKGISKYNRGLETVQTPENYH